MGNKVGSRRKSPSTDKTKTSEVKRRHKKGDKSNSSSNSTNREQKVISCPDLSGAVPYKFEEDPSNVDVKIYRSYSNVSEAEGKRTSVQGDPAPDIRIYRRSAGSTSHVGATDKSQTLPRSFGRNRNSMSNLPHQQHQRQQSNGTLPRDRRSEGGQRRSMPGGFTSGTLGDTKGSKRTLSTASMTSIGYKVLPDDFPDTSTIKRKLNLFETILVRNMAEVFCNSLSETVQLSLLSIAFRPYHGNQQVSLWNYLSGDEPINLHELATRDNMDYVIVIPNVLFNEVLQIRKANVKDIAVWTAIGRQILTCHSMEAANELSRIFEYQLSLMPEGLPLQLLGHHAAQCVQEYLKRNNKHLDRNTIVEGVIRGHLKAPEVCPKFSIIIGERELKWNLFEIFKKPGLRKEMFLLCGDLEVDSEQAPWKFYTSQRSDPMLFGYRSLVVDWEFSSFSYQLNGEDEVSFPDEVDWRPDDFHRDYCPYRRLVGLSVMRNFCAIDAKEMSKTTTFGDYVKRIQGRSYSRDRIQPIYRPLGDGGGLRDKLPLDSVNLGNTDTLRLRRGKTKSDSPNDSMTQRKSQGSSGDQDDEEEAVVMVAVATKPVTSSPGGGTQSFTPMRYKNTPGKNSWKASPSSSISGSTSTPEKVPCNSNKYQTGSPTSSDFRYSASTPSESYKDAQSYILDSSTKGSSPIFSQAVGSTRGVEIVNETATTSTDSIDGVDVDSEFILMAANPTTCAEASRRSTVTSDV